MSIFSVFSGAQLRAAFWSAQRALLAASAAKDDAAFEAALARKAAILAEQRARRA